MERHHKFLVVPAPEDLGNGPYDGRPVDYEVSYQSAAPAGQPTGDMKTDVVTVSYGEPIDVVVDVAPYEPVRTRVRFPWASSLRLREFRDYYQSW